VSGNRREDERSRTATVREGGGRRGRRVLWASRAVSAVCCLCLSVSLRLCVSVLRVWWAPAQALHATEVGGDGRGGVKGSRLGQHEWTGVISAR